MWKFLVTFLSALSMSLGSLRATQIESHRLANNTSPESYFINLKFDDIDNLHTNFEGGVVIIIRVLEDTSVITLHSAVLINSVKLTKFVNGEKIEVAQNYDVDAMRQFLLIETLEETIRSGNVLELKIEFSGKISREAQDGVFLGSYLNENGEVR
jgi:ribosome recycling factor